MPRMRKTDTINVRVIERLGEVEMLFCLNIRAGDVCAQHRGSGGETEGLKILKRQEVSRVVNAEGCENTTTT